MTGSLGLTLSERTPVTSRGVLRFFAVAFTFSWAAWALLVWTGVRLEDPGGLRWLHFAGGFGPAFAAVVLARRDGATARRALFDGVVQLEGRAGRVLLAALAPGAMFAVSGLALMAFGLEVDWNQAGRSPEFPMLSVGANAAAVILCYGFGEELGWRGYALGKLRARFSLLESTLILAAVWALWHLPLFAFAPGLQALGVGGTAGWLFSMFAGAALLTWVFEVTRGSITAVALFHGVLDLFINSPVGGPLPMVMGAVVSVAGVAALIALARSAPRS